MAAVVQERTDEDLEEDIEEFAILRASGGIERISAEMEAETQGEASEDSYLRLWAGGVTDPVATTDLADWAGLTVPREALTRAAEGGEPQLGDVDLPGREHGVRRVVGAIAPGLVLEIGESLERTTRNSWRRCWPASPSPW